MSRLQITDVLLLTLRNVTDQIGYIYPATEMFVPERVLYTQTGTAVRREEGAG